MLPTREVVFVSVPCVRVCEAVCASSASVRNTFSRSPSSLKYRARAKKQEKCGFRFFDPNRIFLTLAELAEI
jgi:hypothetical protein